MPMIKQASRAIEHMTAKERRIQRAKYARRNKMHYIDKLLNELEMLNLADQRTMPPVLSVAVNKVIEESPEVTTVSCDRRLLRGLVDLQSGGGRAQLRTGRGTALPVRPGGLVRDRAGRDPDRRREVLGTTSRPRFSLDRRRYDTLARRRVG